MLAAEREAMSHFTVTVVTPSVPTQEELAAALQPFHEFECTGIEDEYVVDVDMTQEALDAYEKATEVRLKGPDGVLHDRFDDKGNWKPEFSKPGEYGRREEFIPPGFESMEVPAKEVESAAKWISGYYGWPIAGKDAGEEFKYGRIEVDGAGNVVKCVDRTNPNKQWDWWTIGGRWKGHLRLKSGTKADQATIGQIDLAGMRGEAAALSGARWDRVHRVAGDLPRPEAWEAVRERVGRDNIAAARDEYWGQPAIKAVKIQKDHSHRLHEGLLAHSEQLRRVLGRLDEIEQAKPKVEAAPVATFVDDAVTMEKAA